MPLRHYQGGPKPAQAAWKCPACHAENVGPLEEGCTSCGAGHDARHVGAPAVPRAADVPPPPGVIEEPWEAPFTAWAEEAQVKNPADLYIARRAFEAGWTVAWLHTGPTLSPRTTAPIDDSGATLPRAVEADHATGGKLTLVTVRTGDAASAQRVDDPTRDTILAALIFYRDNQLVYGAVPGQLDAKQITELIAQLTPEEPDDNQPPV